MVSVVAILLTSDRGSPVVNLFLDYERGLDRWTTLPSSLNVVSNRLLWTLLLLGRLLKKRLDGLTRSGQPGL